MAESTTFDPQKLLSSDLADCAQEQILELVRKLCKIAADECGENGYRGGFRPGNIYATEDGRVAVGKPDKAGEDGWTKVELEYMSPEQFWNGEKTAAGDVYSIALIMYAGLNGGRLPFLESRDAASDQRAAALRKRMSGDTLAVPDGVGAELAQILARALEFDPLKRYKDSLELLAALEQYCGISPDTAAEPEEAAAEDTPAPAAEAPAAEAEAKPEPEPESVPEPEPEPEKPAEPPKAPEVKPEPKKAEQPKKTEQPKKPAEKKPVPEKPAPSPKTPEKRGTSRHQRHSYIRSAVTLGVIALLLVGVGFARTLDLSGIGTQPNADPTEAPVASQPVAQPSAEPTPEPSTQPKPTEVQYMLYSADLSWQEAEEKCVSIGGHLATIKSEDDFARICSLLEGSDARYVWVGAVRGDDGSIKWTDGAAYDYYVWAPGEPSLSDAYDGAAENYIMLVKQSDGTWAYNDSRADPMESYSRYYSGNMAYICQIG